MISESFFFFLNGKKTWIILIIKRYSCVVTTFFWLQAALKRNESVLAIQPPQADQPEAGQGESNQASFNGNSGISWTAILVGGAAIVAIIALALGVAPIAKHAKLTAMLGLPQPNADNPDGSVANVPRGILMQPKNSESRNRLIGEFLMSFPFFVLDGPTRNEMIREALEGKGEIPLIVIVSVAICGTILLLLNIILISCFIHKRRQNAKNQNDANQKQNPPSEGQYF